jgi:hypothetical protein
LTDATVDILLAFLLGAVIIAILMHLHFRNAPDVRAALVSPPVFALGGCLIGISLGMAWLSSNAEPMWNGRIHLEQGVIHALFGSVVGAFVGLGASAIFARMERTRIIAVVFTLILLGGSIGAPIGWLYGDVFRNGPEYADEAAKLTRRGMLWGIGIGSSAGVILGLLDACFGGRMRKSDPTANVQDAVS